MGEPGNGMSSRELLLELRGNLAEIKDEVRQTRHDLRNDLRAIELRIVELEAFRRVAEIRFQDGDQMVEKWIPVMERLEKRDWLTDALHDALQQNETRGWTRRERIMGVGLFVFSAVGAAGTVISVLVLGGGA